MGDVQDRAEVQAHQVLPVARIRVDEALQLEALRGIAGVVDEDVDRPGRLAHPRDLGGARDVGLHRSGVDVAAEIRRDLGGPVLVDVVDPHEGARADEHAADLRPDPAAATGHQRSAAREIDVESSHGATVRRQTSMTTGITIGRRRVRSSMNRPRERRACRRIVSKSVRAFAGRRFERGLHGLLRVLEEVFGLGRVHPAARHDLGTGHDLAAARVDRDDDDDDAFLGEHAPVAQHAVADVADDAVDVHVAGRTPRGGRARHLRR